MGISFFENEKIFKLDTKSTSYVMGIVDDEKFLGHIYYGKKIEDYHLTYMLRIDEAPFIPSKNNRDRVSFYDAFPNEYSMHGIGDYRESSISVKTTKGHSAVKLGYISHEIYNGKRKIEGLPATFGDEEKCTTLDIVLLDEVIKLKVILSYSVFEDNDVITRHVSVMNCSDDAIYIDKVMSMCMDMDNQEFDMITLHGSWARERHVQRKKVGYGKSVISSLRGESGHQEHPFLALISKDGNDEYGNVYGFNFVYSGNFTAKVELSQFDMVRVVMGINSEDFSWKLTPNEKFYAPEVVMTFSSEGIGKMSRNFHDLYRNHLIRGKYKDKKRPILINNWEATYFDFTTEKLLSIAKEASKHGIEMLVMDDGWFGKRNSDNCALGDWFVNEEKISGGLAYLVDEVNKLGMKFGIWFEPEMVSPDSDLYRKHPDWAIAIPDREPALCREQYVLDLTRQEIVDYVYDIMSNVLRSANIEYVKWDMNRGLTDLGSYCLESDKMGELSHRYMLGVYKLQERLVKEFPDILLENCSGGGARFDPGMLYYSPQIWCSDDLDPIERIMIQEGTAMIYPLSCIGAHVGDCPNHSVGRVTPFETRGYMALTGTFGYELDVTKIPQKDREMIKEQVNMYHKYNDLIRTGDYYRIASYSNNHLYDCIQIVSKDKTESIVIYIQVLNTPNCHSRRIKLKGLNENMLYKLDDTEIQYSGDVLMYAGYNIDKLWGDYKGCILHFSKK